MTDDTITTTEQRGEASKPARGTWVLASVGLLIVALLVAILAVLLTRGGQPASKATDKGADEAAPTFTAAGTMELIGDADGTNEDCYGSGGFDDLNVGTQVLIRNAAGETVGIGELAGGEVPRRLRFGSMVVACAWYFEVPDVPSGSPSYSVEVSHRGEVAFTEDEASTLSLSLS